MCLDILTRVFGYLITRVSICSLPGTKGHPRPNKVTPLVNYLMSLFSSGTMEFLTVLLKKVF